LSYPTSYSTPARFYATVGPRIAAGLTAESGSTPDDAVTQGLLDRAAAEINVKIGTRYITPLDPAVSPISAGLMAGLEEQIALWKAYVRRGIGNQETAASAANIGYVNAMATLLMIAKAELDLDDAQVRTDASDLGGGFVLRGECPHFNQPVEDSPDYDSYWTSD
jgi:phage gp36-like protein